MLNKKFAFLTAGIASFFLLNQALAICPICTVVVGAGIGLSHWLGIDDTITGLWIGGLIVSLIMWTITWMNSKKIRFTGRKILITISYYAIVIIPLYPMGIIGHPLNTLWGFDKLLLGIFFGSIAFSGGAMWYYFIKKSNDGHAYFPFQKVVMPVAPLVILTIIFFIITK